MENIYMTFPGLALMATKKTMGTTVHSETFKRPIEIHLLKDIEETRKGASG